MIVVDALTKRYGSTSALDACGVAVEAGAFLALIGPSGCGKSTLLRAMNGLVTPDSGTITVRGQDIATLDREHLRRGIGYVIQSVGLFPHWTIAANLMAVPRLLGWDRRRLEARLDALVALVGIDPALLPRHPHQLSGGQRQRIGVGRALAADPDLILMDEPFSALDPLSRAELQGEMRRIHRASGKTIVMVTHDVGEALGLATRLAVMRAGRVVRAGTPSALLAEPGDPFVAGFLGGPARHLHRLDSTFVEALTVPGAEPGHPRVAATATLRDALGLMMAERCVRLTVQRDGVDHGTITLDALVGGGPP